MFKIRSTDEKCSDCEFIDTVPTFTPELCQFTVWPDPVIV